ncbi:MAG: YlmC/YmxH family sporulation protein [Anaerovoracaceae bacterium]|nr:YlmC/YmxH family sporulation protein [Anaerovoracaceae bacterium]
MLLSEIGDKEVVDIVSGTMHGKLWDAEMLFDEKDGTIKSLIVPDGSGIGGRYREEVRLPWASILVVGEDMIIFRSE